MAAWIYKGGQQYFKSGLRGSGSTLAKTSSQYLLDFSATLAAGVGNNTASMNGIIRGIMKGAALTSTAVLQAAVHGVYWITSTNSSAWPKAAVVGEVHDGTTTADAAFVALLGGDAGGATSATAAFAVRALNSLNTNQFTYGIDFGTAISGYNPASGYFATADVRFSNGALFVAMTTAVTANVTTTTAPAGSLGMTTNATGKATIWISDGSKWQKTV